MKKQIYHAMSIANDIKAVRKGRILQRIWNKFVGRNARKLMK